jgi:hypothetical protein
MMRQTPGEARRRPNPGWTMLDGDPYRVERLRPSERAVNLLAWALILLVVNGFWFGVGWLLFWFVRTFLT